MSLWHCAGCTTAYSVGAPRCPHCGSTDYLEDPVPKTTRAGGASHHGYIDVSPDDVAEPDWQPAPEPAPEPADAAVFAGVETPQAEAQAEAEAAAAGAVEDAETETPRATSRSRRRHA